MITLHLDNGRIFAEIAEGDKIAKKEISFDTLGSIFQKHSAEMSPLLPVEEGLVQYAKKGNNEYYAYLSKPSQREVKYQLDRQTLKYQIVTPHMLWFVHVKKTDVGYTFVNSKTFALKGTIFLGNEPLFLAPFSNVYNDDRICWGRRDVEFPSVKSIQSMPNRFFMDKFNNDLDSNRFRTFKNEERMDIFRTNHLFAEMNKRLTKEQPESFEQVLSLLEDALLSQGSTYEQEFKNWVARGE